MKILTIFVFIFTMTSCRYFQKKEMIDKQDLTDIVIIGVDKRFDFSDSIPDIDLTGIWKQHSAWVKMDSNWKGFKSININRQYEFHANGVFYYTKSYNDTLTTPIEHGDFMLRPEHRVLTFMKNAKGDTLFQHGDSVKFAEFYIYSLCDTILRLQGCFIGDCEDEEFIEYHRL